MWAQAPCPTNKYLTRLNVTDNFNHYFLQLCGINYNRKKIYEINPSLEICIQREFVLMSPINNGNLYTKTICTYEPHQQIMT
jgi:hypothetical protein